MFNKVKLSKGVPSGGGLDVAAVPHTIRSLRYRSLNSIIRSGSKGIISAVCYCGTPKKMYRYVMILIPHIFPQCGHLYGVHCAFHSFVAQSTAATCTGLVYVVVRQNAEYYRSHVFAASAYVQRRYRIGYRRAYVFEMRRFTADDAAKYDYGIETTGCLHGRCGVYEFEAAGHVHAEDVFLFRSKVEERLRRSVVKAFGDFRIPP